MADSQKTGGALIVIAVLFALWWLSKYGLSFLHTQPQGSIVQSTVGGVTYPATTTDFNVATTGSCCG